MRLYLSSFRMGDHPEHLVALTGGDSRRRVVIANAMDDAPPQVRRAGVVSALGIERGIQPVLASWGTNRAASMVPTPVTRSYPGLVR